MPARSSEPGTIVRKRETAVMALFKKKTLTGLARTCG
jgi:hypothetical protein